MIRKKVALALASMFLLAACGGSTEQGTAGSNGTTEPTGAEVDTTEPIRLGYIVSDWTELVNITGDQDRDPDRDNRASEQEMEALVAWANENDGVGGREIIATGYTIDQLSEPDELLAECVSITEDGREEVVIDSSIFTTEDSWSCFANADSAYVGNVSGTDNTFLESVSPYIATPWPRYDEQLLATLNGMKVTGFLDEGVLGVLIIDNAKLRENYDRILVPGLADLGIEPLERTISAGDQASVDSAVLAFKDAGVDRIVFLGGILDLGAMTAQAESQNYKPLYVFNDFQANVNVASTQGNPDQLANSLGISFRAGPDAVAGDTTRTAGDMLTPYGPTHRLPGMVECHDILSEATGRDYDNPGASGMGPSLSSYCDNFLLWLYSAREIGAEWTPSRFGEGLEKLGTSFQSATVTSTDYSAGTLGGPAEFRVGEYDVACRCFVAVTDYLAVGD